MPLWAKIDVGLRHHPKLIGRPDADKWLWLCLILHAKEHCPDFIVRDMTPADMRGAFGIKAALAVVTAALAYFLGKGMLVEQPDGGLLIRDMEDRQGPQDTANERSATYYARHRDTIREKRKAARENVSRSDDGVSREESHGGLTPQSHAVSRETVSLELEEEVEKETKQKQMIIAQSAEKQPPAPQSPFVAFVSTEWPDLKNPEAFEARTRKALPGIDPLAEARKARGWELSDPRRRKVKHGAFLWGWLTRAQESAHRNGPRDQPLAPPRRPGAANLHVDNEAHQNAVPGRKFI